MKSLVISACLIGMVAAAGCDASLKTSQPGPGAGGGNAGSGGNSAGAAGLGGTGGMLNPHEIQDGGDPDVIMCEQLSAWCHPFEAVSALGHRCHEAGHTRDLAECVAIYDECVALCHSANTGDAEPVVHLGPTCEALATACDPFEDDDGGTGHECHELGHGGDEQACTAQYSSCMAVCAPDGSSPVQPTIDAGDASFISDAG